MASSNHVRTESMISDGNRTIRFDRNNEQARRNETHSPRPESSSQLHQLRQRRSSRSMGLNSIRHAGGVNSIDNFARSWQRAASFFEIAPARPSFIVDDLADAETIEQGESSQERYSEQRSLLRQALHREQPADSDDVIEEGDASIYGYRQRAQPGPRARGASRGSMVYHVEPQLSSVLSGSYGTTYGSMAARDYGSHRRIDRLIQQRPVMVPSQADKEAGPLLVKKVQQEDGQVINFVAGQSTQYQTIFNSVNVLVGVGILAIPLALHQSGWIIGLSFLILAALTTSYTAKLLAKCLDVDNSLVSFADLALVSFGSRARVATSLLFSIELLATCVALVVLFADSLNALLPGYGTVFWKCVCGVMLLPLSFTPLRLLSYTSMLGVVSCCSIVLAIFLDGLIKTDSPGSLITPATTSLWPENWATLPISLGILMAPWGGHSVFPNIYRDMRHPFKFRRAVNTTFAVTSTLDIFLGVIGVLMFGDHVRDEITSNIFLTKGYPGWLSVVICVCVAIIPITKIPLNASPIVSTVETLLGLDVARDPDSTAHMPEDDSANQVNLTTSIAKAAVKVTVTASFVFFAILVPEFHSIMSLLGSVACFSICIILPLAFHVKIFGKELGRTEFWLNWFIIVISTLLAVVSTVCNFLPNEVLVKSAA